MTLYRTKHAKVIDHPDGFAVIPLRFKDLAKYQVFPGREEAEFKADRI